MGLELEIKKLFNNKLMHQYRSRKWQHQIHVDLMSIQNFHAQLDYDRAFRHGKESGIEISDKKYEKHIPKPKNNFKTRLKFLFTGNF